jgi:hypothetical protein
MKLPSLLPDDENRPSFRNAAFEKKTRRWMMSVIAAMFILFPVQ